MIIIGLYVIYNFEKRFKKKVFIVINQFLFI